MSRIKECGNMCIRTGNKIMAATNECETVQETIATLNAIQISVLCDIAQSLAIIADCYNNKYDAIVEDRSCAVPKNKNAGDDK